MAGTWSEAVAVVLAAGLSRRMGEFKLLLPWRGQTVIGQVMVTLQDAGVAQIVVVTGHRAGEVAAALSDVSGARTVVNRHYAGGEMLSSIQAGLRECEALGARAALLCLGDQPQMQPATVHEVLAAGRAEGWARVVIPSYQMRAGHPILLPSALWGEILAAHDSLRSVLACHRDETRYMDVSTPTILADLDTPADYQAGLSGSPA